MSASSTSSHRTVSAKVPAELADKLDRMALYRGVSRSYLLRELAEAGVDGRVHLPLPPGPGMTIRELAASDVGRAALAKADADAAVALRDGGAALDDDETAPDVEAIAREMAARVAQGR